MASPFLQIFSLFSGSRGRAGKKGGIFWKSRGKEPEDSAPSSFFSACLHLRSVRFGGPRSLETNLLAERFDQRLFFREQPIHQYAFCFRSRIVIAADSR